MVPSWTPDPPAEAPESGETPPSGPSETTTPEPPAIDPPAEPSETVDTPPSGPPEMVQPPPVAPAGRFRGTRRSLGDYARTGDGGDLRRSLGRYVRTGYSGARMATRRFGGTAVTAGALGGALARVAAGQPAAPGSPLDPALLASRSVEEVMDAVVEAVRPVDGTQDAEAERAAIRDALSELLTRFHEVDMLNLDADQRGFVIERFTAISVFRRFELDVGKTIVEKAPSAVTALARLKQVRDYVKESVAASFRRLQEAGRTFTAGCISQVVRDALRETFEIFEAYAE